MARGGKRRAAAAARSCTPDAKRARAAATHESARRRARAELRRAGRASLRLVVLEAAAARAAEVEAGTAWARERAEKQRASRAFAGSLGTQAVGRILQSQRLFESVFEGISLPAARAASCEATAAPDTV